MSTDCYSIDSFANNFEVRLKSCKEFFNSNYNVTKIKQLLTTELGSEIETIRTGDDNDIENNVYNTITNWTDPNYKHVFGVYNCNTEGPGGPRTRGAANNFQNLNCFEDEIDIKIENNNNLIKNIKDISGSRNKYNKFIDLLEKAQNTGDASEPRKKVRKQLLQNKNLLAFIYLSAILGGSYYIYRYLKK